MMKSRMIFIFSLVGFFFLQGQKVQFVPELRVTYEATLNLGENFKKEQKFILIGNSQDYYFAASQNYLNDTGQYSSGGGVDLQAISDYFQERVIKKKDKYNILFTYISNRIRYEEDLSIKWVLYKDTKVIGGIKCQMAATNKYGRRWIAYFSKDYSQQIGPYKFSGLPGLILELYDTRNDYHFTVSKIEKIKRPFSFNLSNYKLFSKTNYKKAKYNLEFEGAGFPPMDGEMKKDYEEISADLKKKYRNPIELKDY